MPCAKLPKDVIGMHGRYGFVVVSTIAKSFECGRVEIGYDDWSVHGLSLAGSEEGVRNPLPKVNGGYIQYGRSPP